MTVSSQTSKETYDGNGITTIWDLPFRFFDNADIFAYLVDPVTLVTTPLTLGTDYTLYGAGLPEQFGTSPGKITTTVPVASGKKLYVSRVMTIEQLTDIVNQGKFFPEVHEDVFDRLTMLIQQSDANSSGAIRVAVTDPEPTRLPVAGLRANLLMGFDSLGNPIPVAPVNGSASDLALMLANSAAVSQGAAMIGRGDQVVNSIAELKTLLNGSPSKYAYVTGYYAAGDGGGGEYYLDAADFVSADNGGTIIVAADGGRWKKADKSDLNVHHFGARGNGTTDDKPAFLAMAAATGGTIRMLDKEYLTGFLSLTTYTSVKITGVSQPSPNATLTKMVNGSIIIGSVFVEVNEGYYESFATDTGSARGVAGLDGLVSNAKPGGTGYNCFVNRVSAMGLNEAGTTHGVLIQGYDRHRITNCYAANHQFGVVDKNRNGIVSNIAGDNIRTALVYPKGDVPASAGGVASGICSNVAINNVINRCSAGNISSVAVYNHASTASCSNIAISNVYQSGGYAPLRIQGGGLISDPTISGVTANNIISDNAQQGAWIDGYTYDWQISQLTANNPVTGFAVVMGSNSNNWILNGVHTLISNAALLGTICVDAAGVGAWDNVSVRNPFRSMAVRTPAGTPFAITSGRVTGQATISASALLVGINGAVAGSSPAPRQDLLPGRILKLSGRFSISALANQAFCNITPTGKQATFACATLNSGGQWVSQIVRLNDFQLTVEPAVLGGATVLDLAGINIQL